MKTLKKTLLILSIILIISCSKDDEQVQTPKTQTTLLSKINYSPTTYTKFLYDESNKLIFEEQVSSNGRVYNKTFVYSTKNKISETIRKQTPGLNSIIKQTYSYDSQDRIIEIKSFVSTANLPNDFVLEYSDMFSYSTNNIEFTRKNVQNNYSSQRTIFELNQNGNYTTVKYFSNMSATDPIGVLSTTSNLEYDTKNNLFANIPSEYLLSEKTKNNITKITNSGNSASVLNFSYEYNQDGYPIKRNDEVTFEYIIK